MLLCLGRIKAAESVETLHGVTARVLSLMRDMSTASSSAEPEEGHLRTSFILQRPRRLRPTQMQSTNWKALFDNRSQPMRVPQDCRFNCTIIFLTKDPLYDCYRVGP